MRALWALMSAVGNGVIFIWALLAPPPEIVASALGGYELHLALTGFVLLAVGGMARSYEPRSAL